MNNQFKLSLSIIVFLLFTTGCTHALHLYHVGDYETSAPDLNKGKKVTASGEQFVFMDFVFDTLYVDQTYQELLSQCPNGRITGINTRYSTSHGFLSWTNKVKMTGICSRS